MRESDLSVVFLSLSCLDYGNLRCLSVDLGESVVSA
jgi:hypothetical protein